MQHSSLRTVGRPRREAWVREQVRVWATSVNAALIASNLNYRALGDDGRPDLWSRYRKGSVTPTQARVSRIEKLAPGTSRYFHATAWALASNRDYASSDLKGSLEFMSPVVREHFQPVKTLPSAGTGKFWRRPWSNESADEDDQSFRDWDEDNDERYEFVQRIEHPELGIDMFGAYLFLLREAEIEQDSRAYFNRLNWLPHVRAHSKRHRVLSSIGDAFWLHLIEPISSITFADPEVQIRWRTKLAQFPNRKPLLQALYAIWESSGISDEKFFAEAATYINYLHGMDD